MNNILISEILIKIRSLVKSRFFPGDLSKRPTNDYYISLLVVLDNAINQSVYLEELYDSKISKNNSPIQLESVEVIEVDAS